MIQSLRIQNLAIIDNMELEFKNGFNVITGESGAGKSIIIDAISLLCGKQAVDEKIKSGASEAMIEAIFHIDDQPEILRAYTDGDPTIIVYRKLSRDKGNLSRLNGQTVPLKILRDCLPYCIQITSQHDTQLLFDPDYQRQLLDHFIGDPLIQSLQYYQDAHQQLKSLKQKQEKLNQALDNHEQRKSFLEFQIQDIDQNQFQKDEDKVLNSQRQKAKHADLIQTQMTIVQNGLEDTLSLLAPLEKSLAKLTDIDADFHAIQGRLSQINLECEDIARLLSQKQIYDLSDTEDTINKIESRLDTIFKYKTKYKVDSLSELLELLAQFNQELLDLCHDSENHHDIESQAQAAYDACDTAARQLTDLRLSYAPKLAKTICDELAGLHFSAHKFDIQISQSDAFTIDGKDQVSFMVSTNPGEPVKPIQKVASGGELSRIMLALKTIPSMPQTPTLIFDEIDTGIGGETAMTIAKKLRILSQTQQLICITHLPQIARLADQHFTVSKKITLNATAVSIEEITESDRQNELKRMVGGDHVLEDMTS